MVVHQLAQHDAELVRLRCASGRQRGPTTMSAIFAWNRSSRSLSNLTRAKKRQRLVTIATERPWHRDLSEPVLLPDMVAGELARVGRLDLRDPPRGIPPREFAQ
jgi:hypothetical protein